MITQEIPNTREKDFFEDVYQLYNFKLKIFLFQKGMVSGEIEDVVQETWLKVWQNWSQFDGSNFLSWILRIAQNCWIDRVRSSVCYRRAINHQKPWSIDYGSQPTDSFAPPKIHDLLSYVNNSENQYLKAVSAFVNGEPVQTTAKKMGVSVNTVYSRRSRGKQLLRRRFAAYPSP